MKGLSVWRPWAALIGLGLKPIETRLHDKFKGLVGQTIFIHAAKSWDEYAYQSAKHYLIDAPMRYDLFPQLEKLEEVTGIIATVHVDLFRPLTPADSAGALFRIGAVQTYGLFLSNPILLPEPIVVPGKQGIWEYPVPEPANYWEGH